MADFKLSSAVLQALSAASQAVGRPIIRTDSADFHFPDETVLVSLSFTNLLVKSVRLVRSSAEADQVLTTESGSVVYVTAGLRLIDIARVFITSDSEQAASASVTLDLSYLTRRFSSPPIPIEWPAQKGERQILEFQSDRQDRRKELIAHLNANRVYYSNVIHQALDSGTIVAMLAEYSWNGKPLIDQVEPQPLTMAGNYLVFRAPVDPIEPSGVSENGKQKTWEELLEDRAITVGEQSADERLIPLPTAGVFAEAVLGRSNSAEKLDITRFWNWQDSPIPLTPTEIAPVATGSRATTEDLKPGQLGQPVLNIVNPPSLPNPAGLGAVLGAVSSGNMFRDMSGLAGTQGLVQTGMQETLQAATDAGQLASANMRTEAQKAVAMGQIAADIVKSVVGAGGSGSSVQGISGSGATINHGKSLDQRGVGAAGTSSGGGGPANLGGSSAESSDGGSSGGTAPGRGAGAAPGSTGGNEQAAFQHALWGPLGAAGADTAHATMAAAMDQSTIDSVVDGGASGGGGGIATSGAPPSLNTPALTTAVANFKTVFNPNPKILTFGQFHITNLVDEEIVKAVNADLLARPDADLQQIWDNMAIDSDALINKIKNRGLDANYPNIVKAYRRDLSATPSWAQSLFNPFWNADTINTSPSVLPATADRHRVAYAEEKGACFNATRALARKYIKAKGLGPVPNNLKISQGQIAGATVVSGPGNVDRVVYSSDQALQKVVDAVKKAVDAGYPVLCGVLSGVRHDMSTFPNPEHYVLVFGRDGDTFVFWDSDPEVSNIASAGWGRGFGVLFATSKTFSTGFDAADLNGVDAGGDHIQLQRRHRYQVYYVQTLPV